MQNLRNNNEMPSMSASERDDAVIDPFSETLPSPEMYASRSPRTNSSGAEYAKSGTLLFQEPQSHHCLTNFASKELWNMIEILIPLFFIRSFSFVMWCRIPRDDGQVAAFIRYLASLFAMWIWWSVEQPSARYAPMKKPKDRFIVITSGRGCVERLCILV